MIGYCVIISDVLVGAASTGYTGVLPTLLGRHDGPWWLSRAAVLGACLAGVAGPMLVPRSLAGVARFSRFSVAMVACLAAAICGLAAAAVAEGRVAPSVRLLPDPGGIRGGGPLGVAAALLTVVSGGVGCGAAGCFAWCAAAAGVPRGLAWQQVQQTCTRQPCPRQRPAPKLQPLLPALLPLLTLSTFCCRPLPRLPPAVSLLAYTCHFNRERQRRLPGGPLQAWAACGPAAPSAAPLVRAPSLHTPPAPPRTPPAPRSDPGAAQPARPVGRPHGAGAAPGAGRLRRHLRHRGPVRQAAGWQGAGASLRARLGCCMGVPASASGGTAARRALPRPRLRPLSPPTHRSRPQQATRCLAPRRPGTCSWA